MALNITLKKSLIGSKKDQIATAASLGLKKNWRRYYTTR